MPVYSQIFQKIRNHTPNILGHEQAEKFSVFIPIVEYQDKICILFQLRSLTLKTQPGEISLPGGGAEDIDRNAEMTAIRETCEELGLKPNNLSIIGQLDTVVTPFSLIVHPFVGLIDDYRTIIPNPDEVEEVFYVPLDYFLKNEPDIHLINLQVIPPDNFPFHLVPGGKNYKWRRSNFREKFYIYENRVIWGLTARIIHHFIQVLKG